MTFAQIVTRPYDGEGIPREAVKRLKRYTRFGLTSKPKFTQIGTVQFFTDTGYQSPVYPITVGMPTTLPGTLYEQESDPAGIGRLVWAVETYTVTDLVLKQSMMEYLRRS